MKGERVGGAVAQLGDVVRAQVRTRKALPHMDDMQLPAAIPLLIAFDATVVWQYTACRCDVHVGIWGDRLLSMYLSICSFNLSGFVVIVNSRIVVIVVSTVIVISKVS